MEMFYKLLPYLVSILVAIISGLFSYIQAMKNINQQLKSIELSNKHELEKLMEQHKVDLDSLKENHMLEMEQLEKLHKQEMDRIEKEHKHEIEKLMLKSENTINEQSQDTMNKIVGDVIGNFFNGVFTGKIKPEDLDKLSKKNK